MSGSAGGSIEGSSDGQGRSAGLLAIHGTGAAASIVAATLWAILAWRSPTSTHHFAPLVAAGLWGFSSRHDTARHDTARHDTARHDTARHDTANHDSARPGTVDRLVVATGGFVAAATAQVVLTVADKLRGPPLLAAVPVPIELALMAIIGAIFGGQLWRLLDRRPTANPEPD